MITDCISPAACLGLNIFCRGRGIPTLCPYPADMNFNFDDAHPDIWKAAQDLEIKFLQDLRSAVSVDSCEAVVKAAAAIPLHNGPGTLFTLFQLLSHISHVLLNSSPKYLQTLQLNSRTRQSVQPSCATGPQR